MTPDQFKAARKAIGMDQGQLAEALGISRDQVGRYERGASAIPKPVTIALDHLAHCRRTEP